jgi:hypothetical protein
MKKPLSLDTAPMIGLNTRIACEGIERAEAGYRAWCKDAGVQIDNWAINYMRLYAKHRRKARSMDNFIDVAAATRALAEACDCECGCIECQGPDLEDFR